MFQAPRACCVQPLCPHLWGYACNVSAHTLPPPLTDPVLQAMLELAGAPELAQGGASWAVNERQAEALVRAHEALMTVRGLLPILLWHGPCEPIKSWTACCGICHCAQG